MVKELRILRVIYISKMGFGANLYRHSCGKFGFAASLILFGSCGWFGPETRPTLYGHDMVRVNTAGKIAQIGSTDSLASSDEVPVVVKFSYDYYLSRNEISQEQFSTVMGYNSLSMDSRLRNPQNPIVMVSWLDAVVFCNRLSQIEGLDTVYQYDGVEAGLDGHIQNLIGVHADMSRDGYRLPTEAEWEFAALAGNPGPFPFDTNSVDEYAWYGANSSSVLHGTGTKASNRYGLNDMAGNAMELVHDNHGLRLFDSVTDYVGQSVPDMNNARIVKGGSYRHPMRYLRPSTRSEVYVTSMATRTDYLGFRIARGAIIGASYSGLGGLLAETALRILNPRNELLDLAGTNHIKITYFDPLSGAIVLSDLRYAPPQTRHFKDGVTWMHPMISPNGNWVAVSSRAEGQRGSSSVAVFPWNDPSQLTVLEHQGSIPRWWVDSVTLDTFLIFASSAMGNSDSLEWLREHTYKVQWNNGGFGIPGTIASGAFHGGLSQDGHWLATGYTSLRQYNTVTDDLQTRFNSPQNGKSLQGSTQVCNVSVSPLGELLYLDFGYAGNSSIVGRAYGIHEVLFTHHVETPEGIRAIFPVSPWKGWDYPEWTTREPIAIAAGFNDAEERRSLWLIQTSTGQKVQVAAGSEFSHPHAWIGNASANTMYNLDSLGMYSYPIEEDYSRLFHVRMHTFWKHHKQYRTVVMGSSRAISGIQPSILPHMAVGNLSIFAGSVYEHYRILTDYVLAHCSNLETVLIGLDLDFWARDTLWFYEKIGGNIGYIHDRNNGFWPNRVEESFLATLDLVPLPAISAGFHPETGESIHFIESGGWGAPVEERYPEWDMPQSTRHWNHKIQLLRAMADTLHQRNIRMVGIIFPQNPAFATGRNWGRYGPPHAVAREILDSLQSSRHFSRFPILDFNQDGNHEFGDEDAMDLDHLSSAGGRKLSLRISMALDSLNRLAE